MSATTANGVLSINEHVRNKQHKTRRFPAGFKPVYELPEDLGGGWVCEAPVKKLKKMVPDWNPEGRDVFDDPRSGLKTLSKSIEHDGLGEFPVVNKKFIINGTRRVFACDHLGIKTLVVTFRPWATASDFANYNWETKKHLPSQYVETWLKNPSAVVYGMSCRIQRVVNLVGFETVRWVTFTKRMNVLSLLYWAKRAYEFCGPAMPLEKFLRKAVRYMARFNEQKGVRTWVEAGKRPCTLLHLILNNKPLKGW